MVKKRPDIGFCVVRTVLGLAFYQCQPFYLFLIYPPPWQLFFIRVIKQTNKNLNEEIEFNEDVHLTMKDIPLTLIIDSLIFKQCK